MKAMFRHITVLLFVVALMIPAISTHAADVSWELDATHSSVGFTVRHLGISKVNGRFGVFSAKVMADQRTGKLSSVEAEVDVNSIDTGVDKRDQHLKSPEFFDVEKFPKMTLKTKNISWKGNEITVIADLTIKGVTRAVEFKGEYLGSQKANFGVPQLRAGYSLKGVINRQDFGLTFNTIAEGVAVVGDKVTIELDLEIVETLKK